jgi:hypothetical protein
MKIYARIENGIVVEIIKPMTDGDGEETPIVDRFTPEFISTLVDVSAVAPNPDQRWSAINSGDEWTFSPPA